MWAFFFSKRANSSWEEKERKGSRNVLHPGDADKVKLRGKEGGNVRMGDCDYSFCVIMPLIFQLFSFKERVLMVGGRNTVAPGSGCHWFVTT